LESLRILHVYEIGPSFGRGCIEGLGTTVMELSKKLVEMGHEVAFLTGQTSPRSPREEDVEGVHVVRTDALNLMAETWSPVNLRLGRQLFFPFTILREKIHFDIALGHYYTSGLAANLSASRNGGSSINVIHGAHYPVWDLIEANPLKAEAYRAGERFLTTLLARLSTFQVHTATYSMDLAREWGAPPEKLLTILNGVDPKKFSPTVKPIDEPQLPIVFTARRLVKKNGLLVLLRAMREVLSMREARLVIAGEGPEETGLRRLVEDLHLTEYVLFLGGVPHDEIPRYMASAAAVVVPSYIEASSLFVLEAMAMEKPVIASRVGGIPEIVTNGQDGVLVDPGDHQLLAREILSLLSDESLCRSLGGRARMKVLRNHTWDLVAQRYLMVFRSALERSAS